MKTYPFDMYQAREVARTVGGTAHPMNIYDCDEGWYVLGELNAETRTRSRWERGPDGQPVIAGEGGLYE